MKTMTADVANKVKFATVLALACLALPLTAGATTHGWRGPQTHGVTQAGMVTSFDRTGPGIFMNVAAADDGSDDTSGDVTSRTDDDGC